MFNTIFKFAKMGSKFGNILHKLSICYQRLFPKLRNFAKSGQTEINHKQPKKFLTIAPRTTSGWTTATCTAGPSYARWSTRRRTSARLSAKSNPEMQQSKRSFFHTKKCCCLWPQNLSFCSLGWLQKNLFLSSTIWEEIFCEAIKAFFPFDWCKVLPTYIERTKYIGKHVGRANLTSKHMTHLISVKASSDC